MPLPIEVLLVIRTLRRLPQSWLADGALKTVLQEDANFSDLDKLRGNRTEYLLNAIARQVDQDLALLATVPSAIHEELSRLAATEGFVQR